jgi:hypothetical protein
MTLCVLILADSTNKEARVSSTKKPADIADIIAAEIKTELGTSSERPISIWYVSHEMAKHLDVKAIEFLTEDPSLTVELFYPVSGGLLVAIYFAKCGEAALEDVIERVAAAGGLPIQVLA